MVRVSFGMNGSFEQNPCILMLRQALLKLGTNGKGPCPPTAFYPPWSIRGGGSDFNLFGQNSSGYGEDMLDHDRCTARFRIGLALVP